MSNVKTRHESAMKTGSPYKIYINPRNVGEESSIHLTSYVSYRRQLWETKGYRDGIDYESNVIGLDFASTA